MAEVTVTIHAPRDQVHAVLADALRYSNWVVGTKHVHQADADWPRVGSRLKHTVGLGPVALKDHTEVLRSDLQEWELDARGWPAGRARVRLTLEVVPAGTRIVMFETPVSGPGAWIPEALVTPMLKARNTVALRRLRDTVQHLARTAEGTSRPPAEA